MTDREKLYDLIVNAENEYFKNNHYAEDGKRIESVVERLIANGVTVRPTADLTGKCGSCAYAKPVVAFGGSRSYVSCAHPDKRFKSAASRLKARTLVACKRYKPMNEPEATEKEEEHEVDSD